MLAIAGGIILGFFAIVFILAFADTILKVSLGTLALVMCLGALGVAMHIILSIPYAEVVIVWALKAVLAVVAAWVVFLVLRAFFARVGFPLGVLIIAAPLVFSYYALNDGDPTMEWWRIAMLLEIVWGVLVAWVLLTISQFSNSSEEIGNVPDGTAGQQHHQ